MKIPIIIDGHLVEVDKGATIINAAKKAGVFIPTLCYHEALKPYGACRLCMVEVVQNKQRRLVTSCNYPAEAGMEVLTDTLKVRQMRRKIVELLLARCPEMPAVQTLARRMGIEISGFKKRETKECILCGLCVRFCEEVVGVSAIGLSNRGTEREVSTPFKAASDVCIGCGSCTYICPTGCIEMVADEKTSGMRSMNMGNLLLKPCPYDYKCETCDIEKQFIKEMKDTITQFRDKFQDTTEL
jgi:NADH dehydrogenase/NADH:ubiquinone oxidoreductase subunit G